MLSLPASVHIYLARQPTDLRKGFDGLAALVKAEKLDIFSGHLFAFISKSKTRAKIIAWERNGFVLYYKRLEKGRFKLPKINDETLRLDATELALLLDGVDLAHIHRPPTWIPPKHQD